MAAAVTTAPPAAPATSTIKDLTSLQEEVERLREENAELQRELARWRATAATLSAGTVCALCVVALVNCSARMTALP
jgi:predicted RNase H-like nuclease (RuvC/YqgF family)